MTIAVTYQGKTLATADTNSDKVVSVEGNYYFDQSVIDMSNMSVHGEGKNYFCPVKRGYCDYYDLKDESGTVITENIGWIYDEFENKSFTSIKHKMAFDKSIVEVSEM
jgi:uncharacterized protein (DUF427 family)